MKTGLSLVCVGVVAITWGLWSAAGAQVNQEWVARYNGTANYVDEATSLVVDGLGNVYVTGKSNGTGTSQDYLTIKYDPSGNQLWASRYNGPTNLNDVPKGLAVDSDGNVYVTGYSWGGVTGYDYATLKYDASGVQLWVTRYNGPPYADDWAFSLAVDSDGNVYVTGQSYNSDLNVDYTTIKYDASGNQLWLARYDGPANHGDYAYSIALDGNRNVYVTGMSFNDLNGDYATVKYGPGGNQLWAARYNGPGDGEDMANSVAVDDNGNVYVTGNSYDANSDYATIKYDDSGNQLWAARYNGPGNGDDLAQSIALDTDGSIYVTGRSSGSGTGDDYATLKYDTSGNQSWVARYNGPGNGADLAWSLAIDGDGGIYVTGESPAIGLYVDYATLKYDASGNQLWVARYSNTGNYPDRAYALAVDSSGNVYVTGASFSPTSSNDYATIKYSQEEAVEPWLAETPLEFALKGATPNPFNASTAISYKLQASRQVILKVYDTAGRLVATLVNERQQAGTHQVIFDGARLASGIYLAKLQAGEFTAVEKLVLLK